MVITIIAMLASLLLPVLSRARSAARQTACLSNLRQVNLAILLYGADYADALPLLPDPNPYPNGVGAYYKQLVKGYLGLTGPAQKGERVFNCPSDRIICTQPMHAFTSYTFNGYETGPGDLPRITGQTLTSIKNPAKAVLAGEYPAFFGGAWHPSMRSKSFADARNGLSFVDGHIGAIRIYWDGVAGSQPRNYEPPTGYDYHWAGE